MTELARKSVAQAYKKNPNALGFVIHGSRVNEEVKEKKQPERGSDVDVITIRQNHDGSASEELASVLWKNIALKYNMLIDTGPWGCLEWEEILQAVNSNDEKKRLQQKWKHLGESVIIIGANKEIEATIRKVLFE